MIPVKICGITTPESAWSAICNGADFIGFVFYPPSPRAVTPQKAADIVKSCAGQNIRTVGLFVDPTDSDLQAVFDVFSPDMIQLHGAESPDRVRWIRMHAGRPVIKAIGVSCASDVAAAKDYESVADWILFDAKPHGGAPGGTGRSFDWTLLKDYRGGKPWMLSGGLNVDTIGAALSACSPGAIDLSSGVEDAPGQKSESRINQFFEELGTINQSPRT